MVTQPATPTESRTAKKLELEAALAEQRARLVRLCARLTGNTEAAEDLAQETLLESWRIADRLRDQDGLAPWLSAIARNVCRRWTRRHGRETRHQVETLTLDEESAPASLSDSLQDESDPMLDLERQELANLLERALGLLPPETQKILIASYIQETPQAELAARLGLNEGALRVRLHRGKLALRRILSENLGPEASAYWLTTSSESEGWQGTRIWCPFCGKYRLRYRVDWNRGSIRFYCSGSCIWPDGSVVSSYFLDISTMHRRGKGLTSPKAMLSRLLLSCHTHYRHDLATNEATCHQCGEKVLLVKDRYHLLQAPPPLRDCFGLHYFCSRCGLDSEASVMHLTLDLPETQDFWKKHPRLMTLQDQEIEFAGRPALLTRLESLSDKNALEVIAARDTYEVLQIVG
jgi:RNA polymerase sigma-70 factor (ECF subfamily)